MSNVVGFKTRTNKNSQRLAPAVFQCFSKFVLKMSAGLISLCALLYRLKVLPSPTLLAAASRWRSIDPPSMSSRTLGPSCLSHSFTLPRFRSLGLTHSIVNCPSLTTRASPAVWTSRASGILSSIIAACM